jgi:hypothetical protein
MDEVLACGQDQFENISNIGNIYFILNVPVVNEHEIVKKNILPSFMRLSCCLSGKIAFLRNKSIFTSVISKITVYKFGTDNKNLLQTDTILLDLSRLAQSSTKNEKGRS